MPRFAPTRAGIVNLWDYRDEEFLFVDGWLVLRGPNGSGKTKALEVLFPYVLDGRIEPRRLNPFAGEDRTMKSNLLYRGQEVAHAYVWMEFGDGRSFVTIGIGLRAHRHNDRVTRWHFVADGRVGVDISLLDGDDRPVSRKDLVDALGAEALCDSAEEYRHLVDAKLFGLGPARYEQLLDLVLTLRKPQLAKDLNPAELSRTLQRGLRPVEDALLVEAARSFDDMEAVARTLEGLVAADTATAAFLGVYATYLRTHARAAADTLSERRAEVDRRVDALADARSAADAAQAAEVVAADTMRAAEGVPGRLRAHLDRLKSSAAYRSHEQLADLQGHVHDLADAARRDETTATDEAATVTRRRGEWQRAVRASADATGEVQRLADDLSLDAEAAGISWHGDDSGAPGLTDRIAARVEARRADVRVVRDLVNRFASAESDHVRAAEADRAARAAVDDATATHAAAEAALAATRGEVVDAVRRWADDRAGLLAELDLPGLPEALAAAVDGPSSLREVYTDAVTGPVASRQSTLAELGAKREATATERAGVVADRDRITAEHDDAPPPSPTRPAPRDGRPGAPLWRLVRFADEVADADAAAIEAALQAAGLLDAWLHPEAAGAAAALSDGEQDAYLRAGTSVAGRSLADVLVPEGQTLVAAARITEMLRSIPLADVTVETPAGVDDTGRWAQGSGVGRFAKDRCEYIGATARAARRAARVAECERRIAEIDIALAEIDAARTALGQLLSDVEDAARALPPLTPILDATRAVDRAATEVRLRHETAAAAAVALDAAVAEHSAARGALARATADRALPADRLEAVAEAVDRFARRGHELHSGHRAAAAAAVAEEEARERHDEAVDRHEAALEAARAVARRHGEKAEELRTLQAAIGAEAQQVLAEIGRTDDEIAAAEETLRGARTASTAATREAAVATTRVDKERDALTAALREARQDAAALRPFAQPDLLRLVRCPTDLRWPAVEPDGDDLDPAIVRLHEAVLAATRELTPTETSLKQSSTRTTSAYTELQAQLPAAGLDHRPELEFVGGVIVVRVADEQGLTPVAHFADRIAAQRRSQEQLLTDAEQQVFEDALLGQLARQIHHRTIEARDLVDAMDVQMRARRMSSGLTVGVGWRLADDLDPEQREVCKLLERDPARLGPAQLTTLRRHFAGRIKAARAQAPEKPYRELLADVLDYRQWRVFAFTLHRPGATPEPLTRSRHSQLSGGEQSVSLHLPLFAAANAVFDSARPEAPRLLGLDEAFAGVDETGRGELMSLAKQFDLDLFMTGYDLWATHPAVKGAAHYDLSHSAVTHTVSTVLLVWDGETNVVDFDGSLAQALGSPETRRVAVADGTDLFSASD